MAFDASSNVYSGDFPGMDYTKAIDNSAAAGDGSDSWWSKNKSWLQPSLNLGMPVAGLAGAALKGLGGIPYAPQLQSSANSLLTAGKDLMAPLLQGSPLPKGAEATVQAAQQAQKAAIMSQAAASGQLGSSSTQQALAQVDLQGQQQRFLIANQMYSAGVQDITQGDALLTKLGTAQLAQDAELQKALSGIAQMFMPGKDEPSMIKQLSNLFS